MTNEHIDGGAVFQIERLAREAAAVGRVVELDGVKYSAAPLHDLRKQKTLPATLAFATLKSFADFVKKSDTGEFPGGLGEEVSTFVHVVSPTRVEYCTELFGDFNQRAVIAAAVFSYDAQCFGRFLTNEEFVIWLLSRFTEDENADESRGRVLTLVGNRAEREIVRLDDDGVSEMVTIKKGAVLKEKVKVENPVKLRPFRTFAEITQPVSPFILRLRGGGEGESQTAALFEADGGAWRVTATDSLKAWLDANIGDAVPVYG